MNGARTWWLLGSAIVAQGCIPPTPALVAHRRYEDAICHARNRDEARLVAEAIERDADVRFSLCGVHRSELAPVLGANSDSFASRITLVRSVVGANDVPLHPRPYVTLRSGDQKEVALLGGSFPSDDSAALLFGLTGEKLPISTTAVDPEKLRKEVLWAFFTVGLKQLLFGTENVTYERPPARADYVASGPRAMAIYDALSSGRGVVGYLVPRAAEESTDLVIDLEGATSDEDFRPCRFRVEWRKRLGEPGKTLVEAIDETIGTRVLRPRELGVAPKMEIANRHGAWALE